MTYSQNRETKDKVAEARLKTSFAEMTSPAGDPTHLITKFAESGMGIRFGRGVVAKTGYAIVGVLVIWLGVALRINDSIVQNVFLIACGVVATALVIWWIKGTQSFAERNPAQAMLDGAEFVEYKKFEATTKEGRTLTGPQASDEVTPRLEKS